MLQTLADESENLNMNKSKTKVMMENDTPIYIKNSQIENVESYLYIGSEIEHTNKKTRRRDSKKNHGCVDSIRQAPRYTQRYHWNMLEETSLQLVRISSNHVHRHD